MKMFARGFLVLSSVVALSAVGCASGSNVVTAEGTASYTDEQVNSLQQQLEQRNREIAQLQAKQQGGSMQSAYGESGMLLPPAKPGECYARVFIPPKFETVTEKVLKRSPGEKLEVIPAKYKTVTKKVLVKAASEKIEVVPAEYGWVEEKVLVSEATTKVEKVPAKYEWKTEKVLVKPAHTVWKKGKGPIQKMDNATGEIMCLVEIPAEYKTVKKKVMVSPPTVKEIKIPAKYKVVKKKVVVKPAQTRKITIPAEYKTVQVKVVDVPAQERRIPIPAEYQTITKTKKVTDGRMAWRRILCETNTSPDLVANLQRALQRAGYNPGKIDGVLGKDTVNAMKSYQRANNLAVGSLTYETLRSLGVM